MAGTGSRMSGPRAGRRAGGERPMVERAEFGSYYDIIAAPLVLPPVRPPRSSGQGSAGQGAGPSPLRRLP